MKWNIDVKERLYINLADEILFRIIHEQFPLGSKLPAINGLIKSSHTSQETMRKALCLLARQGIVIRTSRGYYITDDAETLKTAQDAYVDRITNRYKELLERVQSKENLE